MRPGPKFIPEWLTGFSGSSAPVGKKRDCLSLEIVLPDPHPHPPGMQIGAQHPGRKPPIQRVHALTTYTGDRVLTMWSQEGR